MSGLSAVEAAAGIRAREFSSEELVRACLKVIEEREPTVRAWEFLDPEMALARARRLDASEPAGPLHGVPVGVKDLFDTVDMPTRYGSPIYDGYRPPADAEAIARLRAAGAIILGKTRTTEFALYHPTETTNPLDPGRTPGGSSSGSAAAVAASMVPVATGTQTVGSIIRPASFCGVFGYKPTFGSITRAGALSLSSSLDTAGFFARTVEDLKLFAEAATRTDSRLPSFRLAQPLNLDLRIPDEPRIGFVRTPQWPELEADIQDRLEGTARRLAEAGARVEEVALPAGFDELAGAQEAILETELSYALSHELENHPEMLSDSLREIVEKGHSVAMEDYFEARKLAAACRWESGQLFRDHDVLLAPSVRGEAPVGLGSTGDPVFCQMWTLLGLPCVSVPGIQGPNGLPLGAQIIGPMYGDGLSLGVAGWASRRLP